MPATIDIFRAIRSTNLDYTVACRRCSPGILLWSNVTRHVGFSYYIQLDAGDRMPPTTGGSAAVVTATVTAAVAAVAVIVVAMTAAVTAVLVEWQL